MKTLLLLIVFVLTCSAEVSIKLVGKLPYDNTIFTQGLVFHNGNLFISGGLYGESALYKYEIKTEDLQKIVTLPSDQFAEGITIADNKIYQLTWKGERGYVYDLESYENLESFTYTGQGWGITNNGSDFYMSNGSDNMSAFGYSKALQLSPMLVTDSKQTYKDLNELEFIEGYVFANVWQKDVIVIIDPSSGEVVDMIYPKKLIPAKELKGTGVLNGIAYDKEKKLLYITGKNWYDIYIFELKM